MHVENLIDARVVSLTWLATDIAPVGQFVYGDLTSAAVDVSVCVIVAMSTRFTNCDLTGTLVELHINAGGKTITLSVDDSKDNVFVLPQKSNNVVARLS